MKKTQSSDTNTRVLLIGFLFIIGIIFFYAAQFIHFNQSSTDDVPTADKTKEYPEEIFISYQNLIETFYKDRKTTVFVDTRSQEAYIAGHIPQSINVSRDSINSIHTDKVTSFIIITSSGNEKGIGVEAYESLRKKTSATISILQGGFEAWEAFGGQIASFGDPSSMSDHAKINTMSAEELKKQIDEKRRIFILDTRTPQAFSLEHIPGAVNIPLTEIENKMDSIPAGRTIVAYGGSEIENFQTGVLLSNLHFFATNILKDGFLGWKKNDFPIER